MTSEAEAIKTNEFLRRRKLRLQQVREQSKDIAKKIRQRAKVEKLRQVVDLDAKKQKEYFECQERLVKHLEVLYARGLDNVGAGHHSASELAQQDEVIKTDLSKVRGKEAVAELRRKKQEKLDQQKKLLDRKLQAREVANEISREKSSTVAHKVLSKPEKLKVSDDSTEKAAGSSELAKETNKDVEKNNNVIESIKTADMATQWDMESMPHEWEPAVPALSLPTDKDTPKDSDEYVGGKPDKNRRLDLFALSKEMPASLRGQHSHESKERELGRPSLTIVSEYLQNRKLRLRENEPTSVSKKSLEDMQSLKQTIQRTRSTKPEVSGKVSNDKVKNTSEVGFHRKSSVMMYNHSTRDTRDLPYGEDKLVIRDPQHEEDAYSQAMRQVSALGVKDKDSLKKVQDMRSKVAVTKQNVEKEYKDTMNFLNSLPKDKSSKSIKSAYMDERRQLMQEENRQQKMQQEYKKIEKECRKHNCSKNQLKNQSRSPSRLETDENFDSRDFQYSWMPVPESDGNLAIHAIPNTVRQGKSGNSVKFSKVDSYHEYRSRHKHTPPTKDIQDRPTKKVVETVIIDKAATESSDTCSVTSEASSIENLKIGPNTKHKSAKEINQNLSAAERIIIYKVLDSKTEKKTKRQTKLLNEIAKSLTCIEKGQKKLASQDGIEPQAKQSAHVRSYSKSADNAVSFEHLNEGVYKMVEEQGDNIASMYFNDREKVGETQSENAHMRPCHCKQPHPSEKSSAAHWETADGLLTAGTTTEGKCPSATKNVSKPPAQASTAPSTSSYITANNDKGSTSEGGFIKLVDESGHEAGKFYIGATGFLNNNTYEVVIQLRKKDGTPLEKNIDMKTAINHNKQNENSKNNDEDSNNDVQNNPRPKSGGNNVQVSSDEDLREVLGYRSDTHKQSFVIPPQELCGDVPDQNGNVQNGANTGQVDDLVLIQSNSVNKDVSDKGVHIHIAETKTSQAPKTATTTYTQTTPSSPLHRPVFFHMSSSSSTAYMSPPEMILPKFFRQKCGSDIIDSEVYDPIQRIEVTANEYCEEYAGCTCRKCLLARKVTLSKVPMYRRQNETKKEAIPNTGHNAPDVRPETQDISRDRNVPSTVSSNVERTIKPKCSHHKRRHAESIKRHCYRNQKQSIESVRSSRNMGLNLNLKNRYKSASTNRDKKSDSSINPIIKDYVNKLLALNREGLKAVEVADQECSSVGTPGSSIINVPFNVDERKTSLLSTISLEQIKSLLKQQIMEEELTKNYKQGSFIYSLGNSKNSLRYSSSRTCRKKPVHKVKSLNISKQLLKLSRTSERKPRHFLPQLYAVGNVKTRVYGCSTSRKTRCKSSPTPRQVYSTEPYSKCNDSLSTTKNSIATVNCRSNRSGTADVVSPDLEYNNPDVKGRSSQQLPLHRATATESTVASGTVGDLKCDVPISMSTQTSQNKDVNTDSHFMKLAEDKLHNMEKIADLTEKCTKRLSNLAKVLQEVRKNKSLVYSQISSAESTDSHSDHKSEEEALAPLESNDIPQILEKSPEQFPNENYKVANEILQSGYITVLPDIPKPSLELSDSNIPSRPKSADKLDSPLHLSATTAEMTIKSRPKPPTALSRVSFKHGQEYVIPHELSTVIEVDSPMSMKLKNQSARNDLKDSSFNSNRSSPRDNVIEKENVRQRKSRNESNVNPDLLQTNSIFTNKYKLSSESSDESKFQMIDLKHFNEIMLEPFISIQEYAKQYNMEPPDEGSNLGELHREDINNDDMSSLHSDGSLPDVIAELLKRNIITEPFKFDTASNVNSTTVSSESTLSMLALSKVRRDRKKSHVFRNKENIGETSDTMSMSSNPDLENAFKKLGMGWASSTLKKTKERLALSSSSNTSSSSLSQFKIKSFNQDVPVLVTDSVSSVAHVTKGVQHKNTLDNSKSAEQQTTLCNSMTVKEFLRNELAKKITFTNKSNAHDTQEEFVSMFETKMPEEMKDTSQVIHDRSADSAPSGTNRARTSTPVQLFKSVTYHSSSSSNVSNGLFSNADDLSSVKMTSNSMKNHSTSDKDDLTIPNFSLRMKKSSDCSKSD
ncbi:uncharacterized protein LOC124638569 isoform X2 [Helicoverpa zea]|uniref:uncharacterized protein LOC124638569 isoform X2 n=1 Tax=Helicoverpa zea TaxID=7113 RepID=UPI001F57F014|nr:uncharacterized protein LOC124638569 isoform X2 [Helicoverpa zea]